MSPVMEKRLSDTGGKTRADEKEINDVGRRTK